MYVKWALEAPHSVKTRTLGRGMWYKTADDQKTTCRINKWSSTVNTVAVCRN